MVVPGTSTSPLFSHGHNVFASCNAGWVHELGHFKYILTFLTVYLI
jgi:hypothetical protein